MTGGGTRTLILGIVIGGVAAALMSGLATAGWRSGMTAHANPVIVLQALATQQQPPPPTLNPKEFVQLPQTGPQQDQQAPGAGGGDCDRILYFFQGRLYQLRPGPTPRNGGNPEFYFMDPYQGPQIPGFPSPQAPGLTPPDIPGQPVPPTFKF